MTPADRAALARLERLADGLTPALAAAYLRVLRTIRDGATLDALARAITTGGADAVLRLLLSLQGDAPAVSLLQRGFTPALTAAALTTARTAPPLQGLVAQFTRTGFPEAEAAARVMAVDRYRRLTTELEPVFRAVIADGLQRGTNPRMVAQRVRDVVGFTDYDHRLVQSFRRQLEAGDFAKALGRQLRDGRSDPVLRRLARTDGALSPAQVERMVAAYERRLRNWRAETWARTAALDAAREGQRVAWQAAIDRGDLTGPLVKRWVTRIDGREREGHRAANGQTVPWEAMFYDPSISAHVRVPGEGTYNCRCAMTVRPAALADL